MQFALLMTSGLALTVLAIEQPGKGQANSIRASAVKHKTKVIPSARQQTLKPSHVEGQGKINHIQDTLDKKLQRMKYLNTLGHEFDAGSTGSSTAKQWWQQEKESLEHFKPAMKQSLHDFQDRFRSQLHEASNDFKKGLPVIREDLKKMAPYAVPMAEIFKTLFTRDLVDDEEDDLYIRSDEWMMDEEE